MFPRQDNLQTSARDLGGSIQAPLFIALFIVLWRQGCWRRFVSLPGRDRLIEVALQQALLARRRTLQVSCTCRTALLKCFCTEKAWLPNLMHLFLENVGSTVLACQHVNHCISFYHASP